MRIHADLMMLAQPNLLLGRAAILSRPPDNPSGATPLRDRPATYTLRLSTPDRGAGQTPLELRPANEHSVEPVSVRSRFSVYRSSTASGRNRTDTKETVHVTHSRMPC